MTILEKIMNHYLREEMKMNNIKVDGFGKVNEGQYDSISISGSGKLCGDIQCKQLNVEGSGKSEGNLTCDTIVVSGVMKNEGNLNVKEANIEGVCNCEGDFKAERIVIDGAIKSEGYLNAEYLEVNGALKNDTEINVDHMIVDGKVKAVDIVGRKIEMNSNKIFRGFFSSISHFENQVNTITCDEIIASSLKCDKISCDHIVLKHGCKIDVVECYGTLSYDSTCNIRSVQGTCVVNGSTR